MSEYPSAVWPGEVRGERSTCLYSTDSSLRMIDLLRTTTTTTIPFTPRLLSKMSFFSRSTTITSVRGKQSPHNKERLRSNCFPTHTFLLSPLKVPSSGRSLFWCLGVAENLVNKRTGDMNGYLGLRIGRSRNEGISSFVMRLAPMSGPSAISADKLKYIQKCSIPR